MTETERTERSLAATLALLDAERPQFHYVEDAAQQWSIGTPTLTWLVEHLGTVRATLETGCGYSTVLFAAAGVDHVVVTPAVQEYERVQEFCSAHGISVQGVTLALGDSTRVLPTLDLSELDVVLIDGAHAFPVPALDWYFTQAWLRVGGAVVIDDFRIPSVAPLVRFLRGERPTWRESAVVGNSIVFEKLGHDDFSRDWEGQFLNRNAMEPPLPRKVKLKALRTARDLAALVRRAR
jgi:predicted O-methyltransferase YrrM